jgi:hypothetical protein
MRSSISSSESLRVAGRREDAPHRAIPDVPWRRVLAVAVVLLLVGIAAWEAYWRSQWFRPSYRNSDGLWAITRDRLDDEGPGGVAIVGSSRVLFDLNLEAWRDETGILPVQLALEGTGPRPFLAHIADETDFAGIVVVGVTPVLFFTEFGSFRAGALEAWRDETLAERASQRLSMHLIEPYLAFYNFDTALFTVLWRQSFWPQRAGLDPPEPEVRKLSDLRITRQADMWDRVERDPEFRQIARDTWIAMIEAPRPPPPPPEEAKKALDAVLDTVAAQVRAIRERGGDVVFVRAPSSGPFREAERQALPRERAWDELLRRTDAIGIHFEDHDDLQDVELPEWSHIRAPDTERFTRALIAHLREAYAARGVSRPELAP